MRIDRFSGAGISMLAIFAAGVSIAPRIACANSAGFRPAVMAADADNKDAGKKEEEPKGDPVDVDKLPKAVIDAVKKDLPGSRVTKASKLEDGNYFLDDVKVGKRLWDIIITPKGKIIKKTEMQENG